MRVHAVHAFAHGVGLRLARRPFVARCLRLLPPNAGLLVPRTAREYERRAVEQLVPVALRQEVAVVVVVRHDVDPLRESISPQPGDFISPPRIELQQRPQIVPQPRQCRMPPGHRAAHKVDRNVADSRDLHFDVVALWALAQKLRRGLRRQVLLQIRDEVLVIDLALRPQQQRHGLLLDRRRIPRHVHRLQHAVVLDPRLHPAQHARPDPLLELLPNLPVARLFLSRRLLRDRLGLRAAVIRHQLRATRRDRLLRRTSTRRIFLVRVRSLRRENLPQPLRGAAVFLKNPSVVHGRQPASPARCG
jgi:hypothetical protein